MPAAASAMKPCCGRETQLKIWMGSTVKGESSPGRQEGNIGQRPHHNQRCRLANRPRHRQDRAGQDAGEGHGQDDLPDGLPA